MRKQRKRHAPAPGATVSASASASARGPPTPASARPSASATASTCARGRGGLICDRRTSLRPKDSPLASKSSWDRQTLVFICRTSGGPYSANSFWARKALISNPIESCDLPLLQARRAGAGARESAARQCASSANAMRRGPRATASASASARACRLSQLAPAPAPITASASARGRSRGGFATAEKVCASPLGSQSLSFSIAGRVADLTAPVPGMPPQHQRQRQRQRGCAISASASGMQGHLERRRTSNGHRDCQTWAYAS